MSLLYSALLLLLCSSTLAQRYIGRVDPTLCTVGTMNAMQCCTTHGGIGAGAGGTGCWQCGTVAQMRADIGSNCIGLYFATDTADTHTAAGLQSVAYFGQCSSGGTLKDEGLSKEANDRVGAGKYAKVKTSNWICWIKTACGATDAQRKPNPPLRDVTPQMIEAMILASFAFPVNDFIRLGTAETPAGANNRAGVTVGNVFRATTNLLNRLPTTLLGSVRA